MSNYHAYADNCQAPAPAFDLASLIGNALDAALSPLRNAVARRATEERVAGLPEHLLRDLGYERDWDGSIHPVRGEDA